MELHVGNLDQDTPLDELREIFSPFGKIVSARMFTDFSTRQKGNFGFVRMLTRQSGCRAIKALHGTEFNNRRLIVKEVAI